MPITDFQKKTLKILAKNRNPDSYIAGGVAINKEEISSRYSKDINVFHDNIESVRLCFQADINELITHNYKIEIILNQAGFVRAIVSEKLDSLVLEWVQDTAFRFFPTIKDRDFGYVLSDVDLAINKVLALANRNEVRDIIDILSLHDKVLSLASMCWASCGKDPGFTPDLIIDCIKRHSVIRTEQLLSENLKNKIDPVNLKKEWLALLDQTEKELKKFPAETLGCIYLDNKGKAVINPIDTFKKYQPHFGKLAGCWPTLKSNQP